MAKLYFRYGSMGAGKSIDILKVKYNYEEQGRTTELLTSGIDDRDGKGVVSSRIGISKPAIAVHPGDSIRELVDLSVDAILVDEAQFLEGSQVEELAYIVDRYNIPAMAYGLKNDFQNKLFEGSEAMLIHADSIEEIKTLCKYCDKKATMNLRLHDGVPVYHGDQIQIGGNETYQPTCRRHYYGPKISLE